VYVTEILQRCAALESRIARVYRHLASQAHDDTGAARLWRELALEQETHADVLQRELRSFQEADDSGEFLIEYDQRLDQLEHTLRTIESRAQNIQTLDDAFATAVAIEQSELEDIYDDVVLKSQPAFKLISERIEAALNAPARPSNTPPGRKPSR
jgi:rubrerythrin